MLLSIHVYLHTQFNIIKWNTYTYFSPVTWIFGWLRLCVSMYVGTSYEWECSLYVRVCQICRKNENNIMIMKIIIINRRMRSYRHRIYIRVVIRWCQVQIYYLFFFLFFKYNKYDDDDNKIPSWHFPTYFFVALLLFSSFLLFKTCLALFVYTYTHTYTLKIQNRKCVITYNLLYIHIYVHTHTHTQWLHSNKI